MNAASCSSFLTVRVCIENPNPLRKTKLMGIYFHFIARIHDSNADLQHATKDPIPSRALHNNCAQVAELRGKKDLIKTLD